jgi:hypothetical protein
MLACVRKDMKVGESSPRQSTIAKAPPKLIHVKSGQKYCAIRLRTTDVLDRLRETNLLRDHLAGAVPDKLYDHQPSLDQSKQVRKRSRTDQHTKKNFNRRGADRSAFVLWAGDGPRNGRQEKRPACRESPGVERSRLYNLVPKRLEHNLVFLY